MRLLLRFASLTLLCIIPRMCEAQNSAEVIVIGAGVAGLKAAYDLQKTHKRSVIVLEARDRPYGRIDTVQPSGWPINIERGAQWFHGNTAANPVFTYASRTLKLPTVVTDGNVVTFDGTRPGAPAILVDRGTQDRLEGMYDDFATKLEDYYQKDWGSIRSSLEDAVRDFVSENRISGRDELGLRRMIDNNIVQEYAASTGRLSLWYFNSGKGIAGEDAITPAGYNTVFKGMYGELAAANAVRLNTVVNKVSRSSTGVQITTNKGTFNAKYVICTLPLGVLQASYTSMFSPSIVNTAQGKAIRTLGSGLLNKVIMLFDNDFWTSKVGADTEWIGRIPATWSGVQWVELFSLKPATGQNILVAFQAGDSAIAAEQLSDVDAISQVMTVLRSMFGNGVQNPSKHVITRWRSDPYALGSYSYVKAGAAGNARRDLCSPVDRLYWAGEACSRDYPSTVQGAWLTGQKAAAGVSRKLTSSRGL